MRVHRKNRYTIEFDSTSPNPLLPLYRRCSLTASLLVTFSLSFLIAGRQSPACAQGQVAAVLAAFSGHVQIERAKSQIFQSTTAQEGLYAGDVLRTDANGEAEILFTDGAQVKISHSSQIKISTAPILGGSKTLIQAIFGEIWAHLRPGQKIAAPTANIVVRGTEVAVSVGEDGTTQATVIEGDVDFFNAFGAVVLTADEQSTATPGSAPSPPITVDATGLVSWTGDVVGLPLDFETPQWAALPKSPSELDMAKRKDAAYSDQNPEDATAWVSLGTVERALGDAAGAAHAFSSALSIFPNDVDACVGLALTRLSQGRPDDASAALSPVSTTPQAEAVAGLIALETGDNVEALSRLRSAVGGDPSLASAQALLSLVYLSQNDLGDARTAAEQSTSLNPTSPLCLGVRSTVELFAPGEKKSLSSAEDAVRHDPYSPFALLALGRAMMERGNYVEASSDYEKSAAIDPRLWLIHQELAESYLMLGTPTKAVEEDDIALSLLPTSAAAHVGLGRAFEALGKYDLASEEFMKAVMLQPKNSSARYYYASFLIERGALDEASQQIASATGSAPQFGLLDSRLAEVFLYKQDVHRAEQYAQIGVTELPNSALAHYELGRVYYEEQRNYQAEEQFRIAATLDPNLATAQYALGLVQEKTESELLSSFSTIFDSAYIGSPASSQELTNLNTPGANQRLQAELEDPTAVRSASRSYGDGELDAVEGGSQDDTEAGSYLTPTGGASGVVGIDGEHDYDHGVRSDNDVTVNKASFVAGQKNSNSTADYAVVGDYEQSSQGANFGVESIPSLADNRFNYQLLRLTTGFNVQTGQHGHLIAVVQGIHDLAGTRSDVLMSDPNYFANHEDAESLDAELRWDGKLAENNLLQIGGSYGELRSDSMSFINIELPSPFDVDESFQASPVQAYLRDNIKANRMLSLSAQVQYVKEIPESVVSASGAGSVVPVGSSPMVNSLNKSFVLPYVVLNYQLEPDDLLRFRYQRLGAAATDFQLLNPVDDFLVSDASLPQADNLDVQSISTGTSDQVELDHAFSHGTFVSVAAFHEHLSQAGDQNAGPYDSETNQGLQGAYQTELNSTMNLFALMQVNFSRDNQSNQSVAEVPSFESIITVQYLDRKGYYIQSAWYEQGQDKSADAYTAFPSVSSAFGVVDLRSGKRFGLHENVFFELNNVSDQTYDVFGRVQPGRQLRLGVSQRF